MFNPQLDNLNWYKVERLENNEWVQVNMIDLRQGDLFRAFDSNGVQIENKNGKKEFIAKSNAYKGPLGIPEVEIR